MAYADWVHAGGSIESAQLHSLIAAPPLGGGGSYCRRLQATASYGASGFTLSPSYALGAFYNVQDTRALRLQAAIRSASATNNNHIVNLQAKSATATTTTAAYRFGINGSGKNSAGGTATSGPRFSFWTPAGELNLGAATLDVWHNLRMEVFPIGTAADRIFCSKETAVDSGIWAVMHDVTIPNNSSAFVPWGGNRYNGFFLANNYSGSALPPQISYIDRVTFAVSPV